MILEELQRLRQVGGETPAAGIVSKQRLKPSFGCVPFTSQYQNADVRAAMAGEQSDAGGAAEAAASAPLPLRRAPGAYSSFLRPRTLNPQHMISHPQSARCLFILELDWECRIRRLRPRAGAV